ncbi:MAG TPA: alpha/beta fold hydrolase [Pirellulales bacterium]|nr:alpha/beta fold hydrolase [Pirellulales bacterium]
MSQPAATNWTHFSSSETSGLPRSTLGILTNSATIALLLLVGSSSGCNPAAKPPPGIPAAKAATKPAATDAARAVAEEESVPPPTADEVPAIKTVAKETEKTVRDRAKKEPAAKERAAKKRRATKAKPAPAGGQAAPEYLADVPLIPREALFGNPDRAAARISPDGTQLAYLAPLDGVLNVWVGALAEPGRAKAVTHDKVRGIRSYDWAYTSQHILYLQDVGGDEDWHVYGVDLAVGETKDLTPLEKVHARIELVSHRFPEEILIGLNDRDPELHDLYRVNLVTGKRKLIEKNTQKFSDYVCDDDYRVRFAMRFTPDGANQWFAADGQGGWDEFLTIPADDTLTTNPLGFDKSGDVLFFTDSRRRNTAALVAWDLNTGQRTVLAENERADVGEVLSHPTENTVEAVSFNFTRKEWLVLDDAVAADLEFLRSVADGEIAVTSRTLDDRHWTVAYLLDDGPVKYYHYDRDAQEATFLFNNRDDLEGLPLVKMRPEVIAARDGLQLVSYLTLPPGCDADGDHRPDEPVPIVLNVHGGPWARDEWGFDPEHQLLANRGYAVLSVNFRGSTGLGKEFTNAGNKEWAGKMHDDLVDAVEWAVKEGIADRARVAIMGGSYGGYATLVGLTFTPELFACGVDIVGPSNIQTLLESIPPYWSPMIQVFKDRVGDYLTLEGKRFLEERSPLSHVDRIERPLLIGQGANDPRVKQAESDQIVDLMRKKRIPVTYVLYPDEGHGFARPENRLSFNAVSEAFLARHLGGRYEPIGDAFRGSSITVPAGKEGVPGLEEALEKRASVAE